MKITYITVTYNAANALLVTFDSVLRQNHYDIEHIIIDGASNDNTSNVVSTYMLQTKGLESKHEVRFLSESDKGIYDAMNKGLQMVTGDYVCFLNAGDWLPTENTTTTIVNLINETQKLSGNLPAIVYGDTNIVDVTGKVLERRTKRLPQQLSWQSFKEGMVICHQALYARTDIAKATPYDLLYRFSADFDWCIRLMKEAERCKLPMVGTKEVVVNYLNEGATTANHRTSLDERFSIMFKHYGLLSTIFHHLKFVYQSLLRKDKR